MADLDPDQQLIKKITEQMRHATGALVTASDLVCPRCGGIRRVERLASDSGSAWHRCTECGHVWQA